MARSPWRRLRRRTVHTTPRLAVREDDVRLPDGRDSVYTVVECGHCVGVLPFADPDHVVMVRQYRYIAGRVTLEMPTGGVNEGEPCEAAAQRELAEEAGVKAGGLVHLTTYHTSKSSIDETAHLYLGTHLTPTEAEPDDDEHIERVVLLFDEVLELVLTGEITDSMTIIAVLLAARQR